MKAVVGTFYETSGIMSSVAVFGGCEEEVTEISCRYANTFRIDFKFSLNNFYFFTLTYRFLSNL